MMQEKILVRALDMISAANTLTLPMDVHSIAQHFGCPVWMYSRAPALLETLNLTDRAAKYPALAVRFRAKSYIFFSDDANAEQERWYIAHELGHLALGHLDPDAPYSEDGISQDDKDTCEEEADLFALLLLAPPPLLDAYRIETPENIRQLTGLSMNDSRKAYKFLQQYREEQHEALRRQDITRRARLAAQPAPPAPLSLPQGQEQNDTAALLLYVQQLLVAGKAVG